MKHDVIDVHEALLLIFLGFGGNPEDWHHLMLDIPVNVGVLVVLGTKVFDALMPQKLHLWIFAAGKWDGVNLPLGPDVVEVWSNFKHNCLDSAAEGALDDKHVGIGCVKLGVGPCHEVDEGLGDFCLQLQIKAISGNNFVEIFDHHQVNKQVIEIYLMHPIFKIGRVSRNPHEPLVEVKAGKFGGGQLSLTWLSCLS